MEWLLRLEYASNWQFKLFNKKSILEVTNKEIVLTWNSLYYQGIVSYLEIEIIVFFIFHGGGKNIMLEG